MTRLSLALLSVIIAWSVHLVLSYFLAWAECRGLFSGLTIARHVTTGIAVAITLGTWLLARKSLTRPVIHVIGGAKPPGAWLGELSFMAQLGVLLSAMFLFAIATAGAASLLLTPCA